MIWHTAPIFKNISNFLQFVCLHVSICPHTSKDLTHSPYFQKYFRIFYNSCVCMCPYVYICPMIWHTAFNITDVSETFSIHVSACVHMSTYVQWFDTPVFLKGFRLFHFICPFFHMRPMIWHTTIFPKIKGDSLSIHFPLMSNDLTHRFFPDISQASAFLHLQKDMIHMNCW